MRRALAVAAAACGLLAPSGASAAEITVDAGADHFGEPGNDATCSLREAVQSANANAAFGGCQAGGGELDVIRLVAGGYILARAGAGPVEDEDANETGDLDLDTGSGPVELRAADSAPRSVDAQSRDRALDVTGGDDLTLVGVRLLGGDPLGGGADGGAIRWDQPGSGGSLTVRGSMFLGNFASAGGSIYADTQGEHVIESSSFVNNSATAGATIESAGSLAITATSVRDNAAGGVVASGAGPAALALRRSAVVRNSRSGAIAGGVAVSGGGVIENSTIAANGGALAGGVLAGGVLAVRFSTVASNSAPSTGGIRRSPGATVNLSGSIVAGNTASGFASNCNGPLAQGPAPSLESANGCGLGVLPGGMVNTDPALAPVAVYGGPTETRALYEDSPALDAAGACALPIDQRGVSRPPGGPCDIGAFEGSVPRPASGPVNPPAGPGKPTKKKRKKCKRRGGKRAKGKRKRCSRKMGKRRVRRSRGAGAETAAGTVAGAAKSVVIGRSVRGRPIRAVRVGDPASERVALVVGVIHGDERAGFGITKSLRRMGSPIGDAQIWVIDDLNPDGTRARARTNARGVDLNRNFPHRWRGGVPPGSGYYPGRSRASEPETRAAMAFIRKIRPDVSIHYHQPWGAVLACRGRPKLAQRYAKLAGERTSCRGRGLPGTAIGWTRANVRGSTAFVVELPAGRLSASEARRHAAAAVAIAGAK